MSEAKPQRGRGRPRTVDRDEATRIAMQIWWAEGAESVSLNAICRRTGLSKSSLYREFGGEDGLMAAALAQYRTLSARPMLSIFTSGQAPAAMLAMLVGATTAQRDLPAGCFFTKLRMTHATLGTATSELVRQMVEERHAVFAEWFRRTLDAGLANPTLEPHGAARFIDAQLTLLLVRMAMGDPPEHIRSDAHLALSSLLQ